jgi:hypothetical protein
MPKLEAAPICRVANNLYCAIENEAGFASSEWEKKYSKTYLWGLWKHFYSGFKKPLPACVSATFSTHP